MGWEQVRLSREGGGEQSPTFLKVGRIEGLVISTKIELICGALIVRRIRQKRR